MSINEVFPHPTAKEVVFQIKYPNLFYIENKIADLQLKIYEKFPDSELRYRRLVSWADVGPDTNIDLIKDKISHSETSHKIWTFRAKQGFELNLTSNSLDITSSFHKTYNLGGDDKFRDIISFVLDKFFESIQPPIIERIALRYTDECPIPSKNNTSFKSYYNSVFPLTRFPIDKVKDMNFRVTCIRGAHYLTHIEQLASKENKKTILLLIFDGFALNIKPADCMKVTDELHDMISKEYEKTIKEPVKEYMRTGKVGK